VSASPAAPVSPVPRLALSGDEFAAAVGVCGRTLRTWRECDKVPAPNIEIGGVRRWSITLIELWMAAGAPDRATFERLQAVATGGTP
jgi:hypothetical protein